MALARSIRQCILNRMDDHAEIKMTLIREVVNSYLSRNVSDLAFILRITQIIDQYR